MSEDEKLRRQQYKRNRKKWIIIQAVALALVTVFALTSFLVYDRMNRTYYIEYTEKGNVDYRVNLKENSFFDEDYVGPNQSYVSSLIENVDANFNYKLQMDNASVGFEYSYWIDAKLVISNKDTGDTIYAPVYELMPEIKKSVEGKDSLDIGASIGIDYNKYNKIATDFVNTYGLKNAKSMLVVTMNVKVLSTCEEFAEQNNENTYFTALNIPLTEENFSMFTTSSNTEGQSKVLACNNGVNQNVFLILSIVFASIAAAEAVALTVFVLITRNEDVNYTNKVRKILSSYRSFIQQIDGQFDVTGYQVVSVKTFKEMLSIRDTIQSPILMFENNDQTATEFVIPTASNIVYIHEIKVDNYDYIYGVKSEEDEVVIMSEDIPEEEINEALATPDVILEETNYVEDQDVDVEEGVEVVGVVWPEKEKRNKVYRYDPNGEVFEKGDIVLVPTMDRAKNREVIRKAAIAHGNHKIDPALLNHPLKKVIGVIKRHVETALSSTPDETK